MSSIFGALSISGSGIDAADKWINTVAGNIANANDTAPVTSGVYASQTPVFTPITSTGQIGDGVEVSSYQLGSSAGHIEEDPSSPMADKNGEVRVSDVDISAQMAGLIAAQEAYQSNASALSHAKQAYQSALSLGS